jgi:hypothetical protein
MQEILYRESPYIVTVYSNDLEAYNTAKWTGYAASPSKVGNVLFPLYGNAGSENFLLIAPKGAATTASSGGSGIWIIAGIGAAVVVIVIALVLLRRRPRAMEE